MSNIHHSVNRTIALLTFAACLVASSPSFGQSYLDKLEQIVEQMKRRPASAKSGPKRTEELPPPKQAGGRDATTSILQPPTAAGPVPPVVAAPGPQAQGELGNIYLGLEAEGLVGGGLGVRVTEVTPDSPAWSAGVKIDDRIMAVNGYAIADLNGLADRLGKTRPGETCRFLVTRNARNVELTAVLMDADVAGQIATQRDLSEAGKQAWLGIKAYDLTPAFREQFGTQVFRGAAVASIEAGSPAAKNGVRAGDCVIELGAAPVQGVQDLQRLVSQRRPGETIDLVIYRGISRRNIRLTLQVMPGTLQVMPSGEPTRKRVQPSSVLPAPRPRTAPAMPEPTAPSIQPPAPAAGGDKDARIAQLEAEVAELSKQLVDANQRLDEAQQRLIGILESLRINDGP